MLYFRDTARSEAADRYTGYHRIVDGLTWLLLALVVLEITLLSLSPGPRSLLAASAGALFCYHLLAPCLAPLSDRVQLRYFLDLTLPLVLVTVLCWQSGKTGSPLVSLLFLILCAASLTLARRTVCLVAALAMCCYLTLAAGQSPLPSDWLWRGLVPLFSMLLIACLGTMFSSSAEMARLEAERLSLTDDLTGLHNMRSFDALAQHQERLAKRYRKSFAVCMLDSDNLKQINDRFGHLAGTELIRWTAQLILHNIRDCDVAARFGGDEFIILYNDHDKEQILPAVQRIVQAVQNHPFHYQGSEVDCTISAGIASFPADGADLREVITRADQAMYRSKRNGKNRVSLYGEPGAPERLYR